MKEDEGQGERELFLDTTYLLPFFQVPITVKGFHLSDFKTLIAGLSKVHLSELSIYEAKAKLFRLSRSRRVYEQVLRSFGRNLNVLRSDEKFTFHNYSNETDQRFNSLLHNVKHLDAFDLLILSEAFRVGEFLTEDEDILSFRDSDQFVRSDVSKSINIRCWREISLDNRQ